MDECMKQAQTMARRQVERLHPRAPGSGSVVLNWLFGLLLTLGLLTLTGGLFLHGLQARGPVPVRPRTVLLAAAGLTAFAAVMLLCLNGRRFRFALRTAGGGFLAAAGLLLLSVFGYPLAARWTPPLWSTFLHDTAGVWKDFALLAASVLTAVSGLWFSIFGCIRAVKGGCQHA